MNFFKRARTRYILHRYAIAHVLWAEVSGRLAFLQGMTAVEKAHLRELSTLFLHEKKILRRSGASAHRRNVCGNCYSGLSSDTWAWDWLFVRLDRNHRLSGGVSDH